MPADRSITVHLKAEIEDYIVGITRALSKTEELRTVVEELGGGLKVLDKSESGAAKSSAELAASVKEAGDKIGDAARKGGELVGALKAVDKAEGSAKLGAKALGASIDEAGDKMTGTAGKAITLSLALEAANNRAKAARDEFLRTGDFSVLKDFRTAAGEARTIAAMMNAAKGSPGGGGIGGFFRSLLPSFGVEPKFDATRSSGGGNGGGGGGGGSFFAGALPGGRNAGTGFIVTALAVAVPVIGAAISGAVLGSVGLGGIVGGVLLAAKSPLVAGAFKEVGSQILGSLKRMAEVFIDPLRSSADILFKSFQKIEPSIGRIFQTLAPTVTKLAAGFGGFFEKAMPGIESAIKASVPILNVLAKGLPELGAAVGNFFHSLASGGPSAARVFKVVIDILAGAIMGLGKLLEYLAFQFDAVLHVAAGALHLVASLPKDLKTALFGGQAATLDKADEAFQSYMKSVDAAGQANDVFGDTLGGLTDDANSLTTALNNANTAFDSLFSTQMSLDQATLAYKQSLLDLQAAHAKNGNDLRDNTQAGLDNQKQILANIQTIYDIRAASIAAGDGSKEASDKATAAYNSQLESLRQTLIQMGFNEAMVNSLLSVYRLIPGTISTYWVANGLVSIVATASGYQRILNTLDGRQITTFFSEVQLGRTQLTPYASAQGNIFHAAGGLLSQAAIWGPGSTLYAWREPSTGGEGFVPRLGNRDRSRAIIDTEARWYGGRFVGNEHIGGGPVTVTSPVDPTAIVDAIRRTLPRALSGLTVVLDGKAVGRIQGRQVDLLSRGG